MKKDMSECYWFWSQMFDKLTEEMKTNNSVAVRKARGAARKNRNCARNRLEEYKLKRDNNIKIRRVEANDT